MQIVVFILQVVAAIILVALLAIQTNKTEQSGGVMGIGGAGGRSTGGVELAVGAERILKPLTTWIAIGFLISSLLHARPKESKTVVNFAIFLAAYLFVMLVGGKLWKAFTGMFGT